MMNYKKLSKLHKDLLSVEDFNSIPDGYKYNELVDSYKSNDEEKRLRSLFVMEPNRLLISPELYKSLLKNSTKGEIKTYTINTQRTVKKRRPDGPYSKLYSYEYFIQFVHKKLIKDFPDLVRIAKLGEKGKSFQLVKSLASNKWFFDQMLFHADKDSHFDHLLNQALDERYFDSIKSDPNFKKIQQSMRKFYDMYLSGLNTNKEFIHPWVKLWQYLKGLDQNSPIFQYSLYDLSWFSDVLITRLKSCEVPSNPKELFLAINMYLSEPKIITFRQAMHCVRLVKNYDDNINPASYLIPLYYHLIYKTVLGKPKLKTSIGNFKHDPYLKLLSIVIGDKYLTPSPENIIDNYFKRYYDCGNNFKKNIKRLSLKDKSTATRISLVKSSLINADIFNHTEFTNAYLEMVKLNHVLAHNSKLILLV